MSWSGAESAEQLDVGPHGAVGSPSVERLADERWWYIDGRYVPVIRGAQGDEGDGDTGEDDADDDDDREDEEDDATRHSSRISELTEEAKRHRLRAKRFRTQAESAQAIINAIASRFGTKAEDISVDGLDELLKLSPDGDERVKELTSDNAKLVFEVDRLQGELTKRDVNDAISTAALAKGFQPKRVPSILRLIDRDDIEMDDGKVEGIDEAVDALAEEYPEWLADGNGQSGDVSETPPPPARSTGGKKQRKGAVDMEYLRNKYPALRR